MILPSACLRLVVVSVKFLDVSVKFAEVAVKLAAVAVKFAMVTFKLQEVSFNLAYIYACGGWMMIRMKKMGQRGSDDVGMRYVGR